MKTREEGDWNVHTNTVFFWLGRREAEEAERRAAEERRREEETRERAAKAAEERQREAERQAVSTLQPTVMDDAHRLSLSRSASDWKKKRRPSDRRCWKKRRNWK